MGLAFGSSPAVGSAASDITVGATADSEIQARAPSGRFGTRPAMRVDASPRRVGLVRFSVPRLPGAVRSAKLRLHVTSPSDHGPAVYATAAQWTEADVSWKRQPALTGTTLDQQRSVGRGWIQYDVTPAVRSAGTVSFALVATSRDGMTVSTRESRHAPRLRISTVASEDAAPSTVPTPTVGPQDAGPQDAAAPQRPPGGPSFSDDFSGPAGEAPDRGKWVDYGPRCGGVGDWGSISCGSNEHLDGDGHLVIPAMPSAGSALMTQGTFGFVYGTMSAWIKMPPQSGYWPGFWSLNGTQTGTELTGEIDTTEVYTAWPGSTSTAHAWTGGAHLWKSPDVLGGQGAALTTGFHKYSATIAPGRVTYFFDDVEVGSLTSAAAPGPWPWGPEVVRPNFLVLDLAIGGGGQPAPTAPAEMVVDRVEVTP
ncbi:MAG TPA: DNRLRE domain-containing protein [Baekduia sp.]|jgi:beta-glucanase (GH16 family)|nr:DNRLRE domain-containing protein [Baekduia sp.]